jgi:hypothetical protein
VGADLFHAKGQTDMIKVTVALHNFMNAPKTALPLQINEYQLHITQRKTGLRTITSVCFTAPC